MSQPRWGAEELVGAFKEKDEDSGDQFWFERKVPVEITRWRPLGDFLLHANLSFDEAVRIAGLQNETWEPLVLTFEIEPNQGQA